MGVEFRRVMNALASRGECESNLPISFEIDHMVKLTVFMIGIRCQGRQTSGAAGCSSTKGRVGEGVT